MFSCVRSSHDLCARTHAYSSYETLVMVMVLVVMIMTTMKITMTMTTMTMKMIQCHLLSYTFSHMTHPKTISLFNLVFASRVFMVIAFITVNNIYNYIIVCFTISL